MADRLCGYFESDSIHPPNVVLVSSTPTSPDPEVDGLNGIPPQYHHNTLCSPLSTAPNSPYREVSYLEDDDDDDNKEEVHGGNSGNGNNDDDEDDEEVVRPEEIEELLNTPVSNTKNYRMTMGSSSNGRRQRHHHHQPRPANEVPFDEGRGGGGSPPSTAPPLPITTTTSNGSVDPLLGNPLLGNPRVYHPKNKTAIAVVTPSSVTGASPGNTMIVEDIDAYVDEDDEQLRAAGDHDREEKKVEDSNTRPSPHYARYLANFKLPHNQQSQNNNNNNKHYFPTCMGASVLSEEESVPHDERQVLGASGDEDDYVYGPAASPHDHQNRQDFIETTRSDQAELELIMNEKDDDDDGNSNTTSMEKALETAEREVQEMERRVQQMIEQRRQSSSGSQQRFPADDDDIDNDKNNEQQAPRDEAEAPSDCEPLDEPPSLSPRRGPTRAGGGKDVNLSLNSGCSSYYYDGSAMGSMTTSTNTSRDHHQHHEEDDANNLTFATHTTTSSTLVSQTTKNRITVTSQSTGQHQLVKNDLTQDYYSRLESSGSALDSSREDPALSMSTSSRMMNLGALSSPTFEELTSRFDHEVANGSFAKVLTDTSRAFNQVSDNVANFFVRPTQQEYEQEQQQHVSSSSSKQEHVQTQSDQQQRSTTNTKKNPPIISPSHDSDCTPQFGNLSPRHATIPSRRSVAADADGTLYPQPSAKLAKARSLVSGRQSNRMSPVSAAIYEDGATKQRALEVMSKREREVMSKREREQQQSSINVGKNESNNYSNTEEGLQDSTNVDASSAAPGLLPVPPTLYRIAALMEGLGGSDAAIDADKSNNNNNLKDRVDDNNNNTEYAMDWPSSVSKMMEEYEKSITESLRNLSMEEVAGLAQNGGVTGNQERGFGKATMSSSCGPVSLAEQHQTHPNDIGMREDQYNRSSQDEYDVMVKELTFGACLRMPDLDHPPLTTTRNSSTANGNNSKNYNQGVAGILQYATGMELLHPDEADENDQLELNDDDQELDERAVFVKQLSERLLKLGPNCSVDTSGSEEYRESLEKHRGIQKNSFSFESKDSPMAMSPPKRRNRAAAHKDSMLHSTESTDGSNGGRLFVSNLSQNKDLPSSEQASVCSDGRSNSRRESPDREDLDGRFGRGPASGSKSSSTKGGYASVTKPTMVESIDNETGIAKGDVMLSLLCDNSFQATMYKPDSWAWRVREAIWRGRDMRRGLFGSEQSQKGPNDDGKGREVKRAQSLPVDVDDVRVVGGINNVASIQEKALAHLNRDEFEEALELYEDIIFNYYSFFEQVLAKRDALSSEDVSLELSNFKPYIGASLHNLGVIHLLKGDYDDAFSFFKRAVDNRRACLGETHPDCITSMVRLATCRFAMDNFADAHSNLELALALAGSKARTTNDYCQLGEILNNLGCLSYMCGQPTKAMKLFRESLDVQLAVLNSTLYGGSKHSAHSATLSISITRGNIGFLALVLKDVSSGIVALESALREQRLLLTGAHTTLVSTMDHLAVANLLEGRTQKAIKMLRRIYEFQRAAHGPDDPRCYSTRQKIMTIRGQQVRAASTDTDSSEGRRRSQTKKIEEEARVPEPKKRPAEARHRKLASEGGPSSRRAGESCQSNNHSHSSNGGHKVGSVFKAIRSLGRKKN